LRRELVASLLEGTQYRLATSDSGSRVVPVEDYRGNGGQISDPVGGFTQ
jgi:hypothetical protein